MVARIGSANALWGQRRIQEELARLRFTDSLTKAHIIDPGGSNVADRWRPHQSVAGAAGVDSWSVNPAAFVGDLRTHRVRSASLSPSVVVGGARSLERPQFRR